MKRTAEDIIESETDCHKVLKLSIDAAIAAKLSIPVETKEKEEEDEELMITVDISSCIDQKEDEVSKLTDLDPPAELTEEEWKQFDRNAFLDWIKDFDSRILYSSQGKPISYGWGYYSPFIESDWIRCFTKGRARKYYQKHPVKEEEDKALCQDICPLSVLHGLVKLLETRPNVCYGSYEIQIVCHPIKSLLVRHNRSIPEFLKRLLTLYDESEDSYFGYITPNMNDEIRRKEIPKHLQIMIAIFLTENFTFLTTRTIGDPDANPPTTEEVFSARVNDIKAPRRFDEFVISNLYPGKSVWSYTLDNNREVAKYLDQCIAKWRKYMYEPNSEAFVIKPLLTSEKMCITLDSYY